jgi:hypothetical protein
MKQALIAVLTALSFGACASHTIKSADGSRKLASVGDYTSISSSDACIQEVQAGACGGSSLAICLAEEYAQQLHPDDQCSEVKDVPISDNEFYATYTVNVPCGKFGTVAIRAASRLAGAVGEQQCYEKVSLAPPGE